MIHKSIKKILISSLFIQFLSPSITFAEMDKLEEPGNQMESESYLQKFPKSMDPKAINSETKNDSPTIIDDSRNEKDRGIVSEGSSLEISSTHLPELIENDGVNVLDIRSSEIDMQQNIYSDFRLLGVSPSKKNPWTMLFTLQSNLDEKASIGIYITISDQKLIYYRTYEDYKSDESFIQRREIQIEVEIPEHLRDSEYTCTYNPSLKEGAKEWGYAGGADSQGRLQEGSFIVKPAFGSIVPQTRFYDNSGSVISGEATFSLTNLNSSGNSKVYFFEDPLAAAANPPDTRLAKASVECTISGNNQLHFTTGNLERGKTYYYRYYMETDYTDVQVYSPYNTELCRITMPDITLNETEISSSIASDGLECTISIPYSLISPDGGEAVSLINNQSKLYFYPSLDNALKKEPIGRIEVNPKIDEVNNKIILENYHELEPGKTYWYTFAAATNYTSIFKETMATEDRKITMPKLALSTPTLTLSEQNATVSAAISAKLVGTEADYSLDNSKVYIFDNEKEANDKNINAKILEGNLDYNGGQMKADNLSGLLPGKKYWVRFLVSSNYSAVNQWSEVTEISTPNIVQEEYYDLSGTRLKDETVVLKEGSIYEPTRNDLTLDGKEYVYFGWLDASDTFSTDKPKNSSYKTTESKTIKLIYLDKEEALLFKSVPNFDFGTVSASDYSQYYSLDLDQYKGLDNLAVEYFDQRPASTGWSLKVQMSELEMTDHPSRKLDNATLSMSSKLQVKDNTNAWSDAVPEGIKNNDKGNITLEAGGSEVNVFSSGTAKMEDRKGTWRNSISINSVILKVQGGTASKGGTYTGKIMWKLDDTP